MIRIGACSWAEKSMIQRGGFYPGEARSAEDRLRYYAGKFNTVEYDYLYSDDELKSLVPAIRNAAGRAGQTFVMFNNCHGASAFKNALRLGELLI